jgi:hypothetical protein
VGWPPKAGRWIDHALSGLDDHRGINLLTQAVEAVKKSTKPVILSVAKNLQLFVFKKINADASLRSA